MPLADGIRLAADLRPSADGPAVRTSLVAGQLQAASVPIAQAGTDRPTDRQTDGLRYCLMSPKAGDIKIGPRRRCAKQPNKSI